MNSENNKFTLFCCVVEFGKGSKVLKYAKELGVTGGTIFLGNGTVKNDWLNILGLMEIRKEILIMIVNEELEDILHVELTEKFSLHKPNNGIAFSMPLKNFIGLKGSKYISTVEKKGVTNMGYEAIFTIVDKGLSDDVLDAAESAGSTGGTVIHGRGSGTRENARLFNIEIEPEKDIILILSETGKTEGIVNAIRNKLNIDEPGTGIIFVLDVNRTSGLYRE